AMAPRYRDRLAPLAPRASCLVPCFLRRLLVLHFRIFRIDHIAFDFLLARLLARAALRAGSGARARTALAARRTLRGLGLRIGVVARGDELELLLVLVGVRFGVLHHPLDLVLAQAGVGLDRDLVFLAGGLVLRRHVHDAVRVDVERDLDLRHAARRGRDAL